MHLLLVIFIIDTCAYAFGKVLQGPKLWPSVSPGKTWSGAISASIAGACAFEYFLTPFIFAQHAWLRDFAYGLAFAAVVQLGDLFVSRAKRICKVKDASKLLPGLGGFWDRCDSIFAGAIFIVILRMLLLPGADFII